MPAAFAQVFPNTGVDDGAKPNPWLMVPKEAFGGVLLKDGAELTLRCDPAHLETHVLSDPGAVARFGATVFGRIYAASEAKAQMVDYHTANLRTSLAPWLAAASAVRARLIAVVPKRAGEGQIQAVDSRNVPRATIDVSVKSHRRYSIAFHLVKFGGTDAERNLSEIRGILSGANHIFLPQANVQSTQVSCEKHHLKVEEDNQIYYGPVILREHDQRLLRLRRTQANVNVFFVHELGSVWHRVNRAEIYGFFDYKNKVVYLQDYQKATLEAALAHELGHFLMWENRVSREKQHAVANSEQSLLMYQNPGRGAVKISKFFANAMNP